MNNLHNQDEPQISIKEQGFQWMDATLDYLPLAPLPSRFMEQVMIQVARYPRPYRPEPFKLHFLDFALPTFMAVFALVTLFLLGWVGNQLPADGMPALQAQSQQLTAMLVANQWLVWGGLFLVIEVIGGVLLGMVLWQEPWESLQVGK